MNSFYCKYCLIFPKCPKKGKDENIHIEQLSDEYIGMANEWGEQNCFANSALQVLLSTNKFAKDVLNIESLEGIISFSMQLKNLMKAMNSKKGQSREPLNISEIRMTLKEFNSACFEINEQADSMEALQAFHTLLHNEYEMSTGNEMTICDCVSHKHFGIIVETRKSCQCGSISQSIENIFSYNLTLSDLFPIVEFKYKASVVLDSDRNEEEKSRLFKQQGLLEYVKKDLDQRQPKVTCEICGDTFGMTNHLLRIPTVYSLQLVWAQRKQSQLKILQFMKSLPDKIDLKSLYETDRSTCHILRGMIVHIHKHYVYVIKSKENKWHIINDSFAKMIYFGDLHEVIDCLLDFNAYPVSLFYEEDSNYRYMPPNIDEDHWIRYEKSIFSKEILPIKLSTMNPSDWVCLYCYYTENKIRDSHCSRCYNEKIRKLEIWKCQRCDLQNEESTLLCDRCADRRFLAKDFEDIFDTDNMGKSSSAMDSVYSGPSFCKICDLKIHRGQYSLCIECGYRVFDKDCECELFPTLCCKFCQDKLWKCKQCSKLNLVTVNKCRSCSFQNGVKHICKKCRKINDYEVCDDCRILDEISCYLCKEKLELPVCFICPICDCEIDDGYCKSCDYEVDYNRFVCGRCRGQAKRCLVCELGLIDSDDKNCHLCFTKTDNFKIIS